MGQQGRVGAQRGAGPAIQAANQFGHMVPDLVGGHPLGHDDDRPTLLPESRNGLAATSASSHLDAVG